MSFRDSGHSDEQPIDYVICKKLHLTLLQTLQFDDLIHEILLGAPQSWTEILSIDDLGGHWTKFVNRVNQHSRSLTEAKTGYKMIEHLEKLERGKTSHHTKSHFSKSDDHKKQFKKDKKGNFKASSRLIGSRPDLPKPNFSKQNRNPKTKRPPGAVNARPCVHCSGDHWDNECTKEGANKKFVQVNLASTDSDGLAAQEEYDELFEQLSSASSSESTLSSSESESDSKSEQDFKSPSDVLSAAASSEQPVADNEEPRDVSEGAFNGQVNSGMVTVSCALVSTPDPSITLKLPSGQSWHKQY